MKAFLLVAALAIAACSLQPAQANPTRFHNPRVPQKHVLILQLEDGRFAYADGAIWWYYTPPSEENDGPTLTDGRILLQPGGTWMESTDGPYQSEVVDSDEENIVVDCYGNPLNEPPARGSC